MDKEFFEGVFELTLYLNQIFDQYVNAFHHEKFTSLKSKLVSDVPGYAKIGINFGVLKKDIAVWNSKCIENLESLMNSFLSPRTIVRLFFN